MPYVGGLTPQTLHAPQFYLCCTCYSSSLLHSQSLHQEEEGFHREADKIEAENDLNSTSGRNFLLQAFGDRVDAATVIQVLALSGLKSGGQIVFVFVVG